MLPINRLNTVITTLTDIASHVAAQHGGKMPETSLSIVITDQSARATIKMQYVGIVGDNMPMEPEQAVAELAKLANIKLIETLEDATNGRR